MEWDDLTSWNDGVKVFCPKRPDPRTRIQAYPPKPIESSLEPAKNIFQLFPLCGKTFFLPSFAVSFFSIWPLLNNKFCENRRRGAGWLAPGVPVLLRATAGPPGGSGGPGGGGEAKCRQEVQDLHAGPLGWDGMPRQVAREVFVGFLVAKALRPFQAWAWIHHRTSMCLKWESCFIWLLPRWFPSPSKGFVSARPAFLLCGDWADGFHSLVYGAWQVI